MTLKKVWDNGKQKKSAKLIIQIKMKSGTKWEKTYKVYMYKLSY